MTKDSTAKIAVLTADYAYVEAIDTRRQAGAALAVEGKTIIRMPHLSFTSMCSASTLR